MFIRVTGVAITLVMITNDTVIAVFTEDVASRQESPCMQQRCHRLRARGLWGALNPKP